jgi:diguanylate cyclase (GGDEF)-like protein
MHIVVVDASRVVLKVISGALVSRGHKTFCFTDSQEALTFIAANKQVNGLITGLETRPLCGFELCWSARLLAQAHRPIYIIAMSSRQNARNLSEALDSGADDFMSKPPVAEELYARLRAAERLTFMQEELVRLAGTDPLTGLYNRRAFLERLQQIAERIDRTKSFAFAMLDVDHFKSINDRYGHDIGDAALRAVAQEAATEGIVGRLGGEEFGIVYPEECGVAACALANNLRARLSELRLPTSQGPLGLTCSFGISEWAQADTVGTLMKRADLALYEAKASGRNRVVFDRTHQEWRAPAASLMKAASPVPSWSSGDL